MPNKPFVNIVLYSPDIPGNTGSIGRTCLALNARLILIKPYGFDLSEKAVRRAGLDYWKHVNLTEYNNWEEFLKHEKPSGAKMYLYTKSGQRNHFQAEHDEGDFLIFGKETTGLPPEILKTYEENTYSLPMFSEHIRSLNLSNAATAVAYEALRQIQFS